MNLSLKISAAILLLTLSACSNLGNQTVSRIKRTGGTPTSDATPVPAKIADVKIQTKAELDSDSTTGGTTGTTPTAGTGDQTYISTISFDKDSLPTPLTDYCALSTGTTQDESTDTPTDSPTTTPSGTPTPAETTLAPDTNCKCRYEWKEIDNSFGDYTSALDHSVDTSPTAITPYAVTCPAPSLYGSEIKDKSVIEISIISTRLEVTPFAYTKGTTASASDFKDEKGQRFLNIHRYSCYEVSSGINQLTSEVETKNSTNGNYSGSADVPKGTKYCLNQSGSNCRNAKPDGYAVQSNYYNLFVSSQNRGAIVGQNERYSCPKVKEALGSSGSATSGQFYPLDTTFALAQDFSKDFSVPIDSPSILHDPAVDGASASMSCAQILAAADNSDGGGDGGSDGDGGNGGGSTGAGNSILWKCLGFAAPAKTDGSCPSFRDSNGKIRNTFRLRRYMATYPILFSNSGKAKSNGRSADVVYVLDRPVKNPNDPTQPYSILGPKPCNFAYFDKNQIAGVGQKDASSTYSSSPLANPNTTTSQYDIVPGYVATNDNGYNWSELFSYGDGLVTTTNVALGWDYKNANGIQFPNRDIPKLSCSATLPLVNYDSISGQPIRVTFGTVHSSNTGTPPKDPLARSGLTHSMKNVWVRPGKSWAPHYIEDDTFQACAPLSDPLQDPPLHFSKSATGQIAWCAEAYPTQNDSVGALENGKFSSGTAPGNPYIKNYTSHVVKNASSQDCSYTMPQLPSNYDCSTAANGTVCGDEPTSCTDVTGSPYYAPTTATLVKSAVHPMGLPIDKTVIDTDTPGFYCSHHKFAHQTCDRTVIPTGGDLTVHIPLLAPPQLVEKMLVDDPTYECKFVNGPFAGVATPAGSCCDLAQVNLTSGIPAPTSSDQIPVPSAHWEPSATSKFCGFVQTE